MTEISENFEDTFFVWCSLDRPFFQNTLHKFELKKSYGEKFCHHGNCFKKIDYFWKSCFQKLVFDKRKMIWLQTRKRKLQEEIQKSLDEVVEELQESRSQLLYW